MTQTYHVIALMDSRIEKDFVDGGLLRWHKYKDGDARIGRIEGAEAYDADGHCFYHPNNGHRFPGNQKWEGMQHAREQGTRIGMLLDLDQGSMTVWKNGEQLGVMQSAGLSGPLCWAVSLPRGATLTIEEVDEKSARIESALVPPSPSDVAASTDPEPGPGDAA
eukprot:COSAG02_NODE_18364_length_943_cov_1.696682_1_plen_163_part_01